MMMADSCVLESANHSPGGSEKLVKAEWLDALRRLLPNTELFAGPMMPPSRYHGVLAPNAKWRSQVVPAQTDSETLSPAETEVSEIDPLASSGEKKGVGRYISWSRLLRRVFDLDMEACPNCGGSVKIIAAIEDPAVIKKILNHLGLSPHPPPRTPARYDAYDEADLYATY